MAASRLPAGHSPSTLAAKLLTTLAFAGGFNALSLFAGFFVPGTAASFFEDAFTHHTLIESLKGVFEGLIVAYDYFNQWAAGCSLRTLANPR